MSGDPYLGRARAAFRQILAAGDDPTLKQCADVYGRATGIARAALADISRGSEFVANAANAVDNGYDLVCARCGNGMSDDEFDDADAHDLGCPNAGRNRAAEEAAFLAERLGQRRTS